MVQKSLNTRPWLDAGLILGFSLLMAIFPSRAFADSPNPPRLPNFVLADLNNKPHDSKAWKGHVVILDFWATGCEPCRETIPVLNRLNEKFKAKGLIVRGISLDKDSVEKVSKFKAKFKINYTILMDSQNALSNQFGFEGLPSLFVYGRDGALLKAMPDYTSSMEKELEALVEEQF